MTVGFHIPKLKLMEVTSILSRRFSIKFAQNARYDGFLSQNQINGLYKPTVIYF